MCVLCLVRRLLSSTLTTTKWTFLYALRCCCLFIMFFLFTTLRKETRDFFLFRYRKEVFWSASVSFHCLTSHSTSKTLLWYFSERRFPLHYCVVNAWKCSARRAGVYTVIIIIIITEKSCLIPYSWLRLLEKNDTRKWRRILGEKKNEKFFHPLTPNCVKIRI